MNNRGQALIEVAAFLLLSVSLLGCFLAYTQRFLVRQKMLMAARQGALLYSSGRVTEEEVLERLRRFLTSGFPALDGRRAEIWVGKCGGFHGLLYELDRVKVRYKNMEESCVMKHAAPYGLRQPLYGPPVSWLFGSLVPD